MDHWLSELESELSRLDRDAALRRLRLIESPPGPVIRVAGRDLVNLASNDYLGLSQHPRIINAAAEATCKWGAGSGASRLVSGHLQPHALAEQAFAEFKHAEAALLCPTGYMANLAVLTTLAGPGDTIFQDKLNHASLIDAARLSGATARSYPHNNLDKLERLLERSLSQAYDATTFTPSSAAEHSDHGHGSGAPRMPRRLIVTDSVFSMDGDVSDLRVIADLADRYDAILIIDEAHATGVLGETGAGLAEQLGLADRIDISISTASKALGSLGGLITANQTVIDTLINHARSFIYTTSVPASQAAAIQAALEVIRDEPDRRRRLIELSRQVRAELADEGVIPRSEAPWAADDGTTPPDRESQTPVVTPIIPVIAGSSLAAIELSERLLAAGYYAPAIRPPTVPPNAARVRLALRADLSTDQLAGLTATLIEWRQSTRG